MTDLAVPETEIQDKLKSSTANIQEMHTRGRSAMATAETHMDLDRITNPLRLA